MKPFSAALSAYAAFCLAFLAVACSASRAGLPLPAALQRTLETQLQPGGTVAEIDAYLRSGEIDGLQDAVPRIDTASEYSQLLAQGMAPDTPVYTAMLRDSERALTIVFVLDDDLRLLRVVVLENPLRF